MRIRKRITIPYISIVILLISIGISIYGDISRIKNQSIKTQSYISQEIIKMSRQRRFNLNTTNQQELITNTIKYYTYRYNEDFDMMLALAKTESDLNPYAISKVGAKGLFQFMYYTFSWCTQKMGIENPDPYNIEHSTLAAIYYIKYIREFLTEQIGRVPTISEICWAYNHGHNGTGNIIKYGLYNRLPSESIGHAKKVNFYYNELQNN